MAIVCTRLALIRAHIVVFPTPIILHAVFTEMASGFVPIGVSSEIPVLQILIARFSRRAARAEAHAHER